MKKIGLNILIGSIISIVLIVICLVTIKPNYTYLMKFDNKTWLSTDNSTFSYENEIISYDRQDDYTRITYNDNMVAYSSETGRTIMHCDGKLFEANYKDGVASFSDVTQEEVAIFYKYISLLEIRSVDNNKMNVTAQKVICCILSVFIGFILSFLSYPVILFEKVSKNQNLAFISISMTILLCLFSAFYIYFTLK